MFRVTVPAWKYVLIRSLFCSADVSVQSYGLCVGGKLERMGQVSRSGLTWLLKLSAQEVVLMFLTYLHILHLR